MSQTPPPPPPAQSGGTGAIGELRKPLTVVLLTIVTCGIYGLWWYYRNFEDMKQFSGEGIGGGIGLLLAIFCGIIAIFILPAEVGNLYEREGKEKPMQRADCVLEPHPAHRRDHLHLQGAEPPERLLGPQGRGLGGFELARERPNRSGGGLIDRPRFAFSTRGRASPLGAPRCAAALA